MLTVNVVRRNGKVVEASVVTEDRNTPVRAWPVSWENRNDWRTYEQAAEVAAALGPKYQATDAGPCVSPRYDVIDLPQVGQEVSYTFNGDYYPCGKITKISAGPALRRIEATDDNGRKCVFHRRCRDGKPTGGAWVMNGTWSMVQGHHDRRDPEF